MKQEDKVLIYEKNDVLFIFNFHPEKSFEGYFVPTGAEGDYEVLFSSDDVVFDGFGRVDLNYVYQARKNKEKQIGFQCYLPNRTAIVLKRKKTVKKVNVKLLKKIRVARHT